MADRVHGHAAARPELDAHAFLLGLGLGIGDSVPLAL
jgi:hypothetical protein